MTNYMKKMLPSFVILLIDLSIMLLIPSQIKELTHDAVTTRFMPYVVTGLIALCALVDLIQIYTREHADKTTGDTYFDNAGLLRVLACIIGVIVYLYIMPMLGFVLATALVCAFSMFLMGNHDVKQLIIFSVVLSICVYCTFKLGLKMRLPVGLFFF